MRQKILIVNKIEEEMLCFNDISSQLDVEIIPAVNAADALTLIELHDFSLAILDINLADMSGFNLAESIRKKNASDTLTLFFLSDEIIDDFKLFIDSDSGAVDVITRPLNQDLIKNKIKIILQLEHQKNELMVHRNQLREFVIEQEETNQQLKEEIDERKKAEFALLESEKRYRELFNNVSEAIFIYDFDGFFFEVNDMACSLLGYTRDQLMKMKYYDIDLHDELKQQLKKMRSIQESETYVYESSHIKIDGTCSLLR